MASCPGRCGTRGVKGRLFFHVSEPSKKSVDKVSIVGTGSVGMACATAILFQKICTEVCLLDCREKVVAGEVMDLQHGSIFLDAKVIGSATDYSVSAGSKICVVTAGARQEPGESRLQLVQRNIDIFKNIIPELVKYSPNTILMIIANPCDIMTYVSWKLSGLPRHKVIGTGTLLDSARFRHFIAERLGIHPSSCHAYIIGEHGDSSVACWSSVQVAGVLLKDIEPKIGTDEDKENWKKIHHDVVSAAGEVIKLKGYTNWAIGLSCSVLVANILKDKQIVCPVSTFVRGLHGVTQDVCFSLPCIVGEEGVVAIVKQRLAKTEVEQLQACAKMLGEVQDGLTY